MVFEYVVWWLSHICLLRSCGSQGFTRTTDITNSRIGEVGLTYLSFALLWILDTCFSQRLTHTNDSEDARSGVVAVTYLLFSLLWILDTCCPQGLIKVSDSIDGGCANVGLQVMCTEPGLQQQVASVRGAPPSKQRYLHVSNRSLVELTHYISKRHSYALFHYNGEG